MKNSLAAYSKAGRCALLVACHFALVVGAHAQLTVDRIFPLNTNVPDFESFTNTQTWTNMGITNISANGVTVTLSLSTFGFVGETDAYVSYNPGQTNEVINATIYTLNATNQSQSLLTNVVLTNTFASPGTDNTWRLLFNNDNPNDFVTLDYWRVAVTGDAKTNGTIEVGPGGIISGSDGYTVSGAVISAGTGTGTDGVTAFVTNGQSLNFNGGISDTGELAKTGGGTLTIGADSPGFSGTVRIAEGRLSLTNGGSLSSGGSVDLSGATGVYDISGLTAAGETNASLAGVAGSSVVLGGKNLSIGGNNADSTFAGVISGEGGSLTKTGTGTMTLAGANTYTGGTLISGGELRLGGASGALGGGNVTNNATLAIDRTGSLTMGQTISGTGNLLKTGAGTLVLSVANSYSGGTTLEQGTLRVGQNTSLGTGGLTLNGGTLASSSSTAHTLANNITLGGNVQFGDSTGTGNLTFTGTVGLGAADRTINVYTNKTWLKGVVSGTGGILKTGEGTLRLSGTNTYSGNTTLSAGTLLVTDAAALGGGQLIQTSGDSLLQFDFEDTITNSMSLYNVRFTESVTLTGAKTLNGTTMIEVDSGDTVTEQGVLSGTGGLTKTGAGEYVLNGSVNNTYEGATVVNAGTLTLANTGGNAIHSSSGITVNSGATLALGASDQIGDGIGLTLNGGTFLVGTDTARYSETLGTLTLTASSTIDFGAYSGGLGTLNFANSSAIAWSGTLTLTNWQGVAETSSDFTQIIFGTGGLNETQLGQIVFANQGINGGMLLGSGELVPVPEPKIYVAALAIFAAIGWRERRRLLGLLSREKR